jgi:hypothetical protein
MYKNYLNTAHFVGIIIIITIIIIKLELFRQIQIFLLPPQQTIIIRLLVHNADDLTKYSLNIYFGITSHPPLQITSTDSLSVTSVRKDFISRSTVAHMFHLIVTIEQDNKMLRIMLIFVSSLILLLSFFYYSHHFLLNNIYSSCIYCCEMSSFNPINN